MSNFTDALAAGARSAACQLLGIPQYLNDMTTRLSGGLFTPPLNAIPNLWRNALCDTDAPPPSPPPFTGGQCPIRYNITVTLRRDAGGADCATTDQTRNLVGYWGPIGAPSIQNGSAPGGQISNTVVFSTRGNAGAPQAPQQTSLGFGSSRPDCPPAQIVGFSVTPTGGGPDNCGDPPPDYDPVTPPDVTIPRDIPYTNSDGVDVTIPVVFVFARAQIDVDANVIIPFTLNLTPTLNITGNLNVDGTVNFNFGGGTATTRPKDPRKGDCGDIAEPSDPVPTDPTDSEQPPQPDREREEVIKGVLVTVTNLSNERASLIVQSDNPDIYAPSLGHVQFLCRVGDTSAAWTSDQPVKNRRNLIPCPWQDGAIAVRGTPQPGVTWTLTPIRGYAGVPVEYVQ